MQAIKKKDQELKRYHVRDNFKTDWENQAD